MARKRTDPTIIKYMRIVTTDNDGKFAGSVKIYDEEKTAEYFDMEVLFQADEKVPVVSMTCVYFNDTRKRENLEKLKEGQMSVLEFMASDEDTSKIYDNLGIRLDLYNAQTDEVKAEINAAANKYKASVTPENVAEIANGSIYAVLANYSDAVNMKNLVAGFDIEAKKVCISKNDLIISEQVSKLSPVEQNNIAANVVENRPKSGFGDYDEFYKAIRTSMFLEFANNSHYMELSDLILENTDILNDEMTQLKNQTNIQVLDAAMADVILQASKSKFTDIDAFISAVKKALTTAESQHGSGSTGGGGGGSTGGGSSTSMWGNMENQSNASTETGNESFTDLANYTWAKAAIESLAEKGIVSGPGGGIFEPGRDITREEFVKLICEAFNLGSANVDVKFDDVNSSDWFAPYISTAVERDIVQGISDTAFGTGMKITREDMAVIIYRAIKAMGIDISGNGIGFADEDSAADYAKLPISILSANGIINGVGDDMFAPKKNAERAEAAVIVYRCMEKLSI